MEQNKNQPQHREIVLERSAVNETERTAELSFSSETPVKRWYGNEILEHSTESVDLTRLNEVGVLLFNHDSYSLPVGRVESATIDPGGRRGTALVKFDTDEDSERVYQKVLSGTLRGVSVGYRVSNWEEVEPGKKSLCGRFDGPCSIAKRWEPYEISIVTLPADASVGVGRSDEITESGASRSDNQKDNLRSDKPMAEETKVNIEEVSNSARAEAVKLERQRVSEISAICRQAGIEDAQERNFVEEGTGVEEVRKAALNALIEKNKPVSVPAGEGTRADEADKFRAAVVDSLVMRTGKTVEKPAEGAKEFRGYTLMELAKESCERSNQKVRGMDKLDIAERAIFGTSDFPYILANVANKTMMVAYNEVPTTYQQWCKVVDAADFKAMYRNQLSEAPDLDEIKESGEYKHANFSETRETYSLATYGKKFSLSRQAIVNDDLNALTRIPLLFGASAARKVNALAYGVLTTNANMADGTALFVAGHSNYTSSGTALSVISLGVARALMRKQKGLGTTAILNLTPAYLIIPAALETAAEELLLSTVDPAKSNATPNPFNGKLQIVVDALLDANSVTAWYLAASYTQVDTVEVAFLGGQRSPLLESRPGWDVDGMEFKVRIDAAAKAIDHRGLYKNVGA